MRQPNTIYFQSKEYPEFRFMSNFHVAPFVWNGLTIPTVEHLYQACKATNDEDRRYILDSRHPAVAMKRGRALKQIVDCWESIKISVMRKAVLMKFEQNKELRDMLLATDGWNLVEYAPWGDVFWGVDANYNGMNNLGIITMEVRNLLKERK